MYRLTNLTRVAAVAAVMRLDGLLRVHATCSARTRPPAGRHVQELRGASATASPPGYQSGGINDSTQRQSFARLLAGQMGTQYHYASLAGRAARRRSPTPRRARASAPAPTADDAATCAPPRSVTDVLNNVAVPGARVLDPTSPSTTASNVLTTFILGGKTQVQRALDARPDLRLHLDRQQRRAGARRVRDPPLVRASRSSAPRRSSQAAYDAMIEQLLAGAPELKGVLIGVVKVAAVPCSARARALRQPARAREPSRRRRQDGHDRRELQRLHLARQRPRSWARSGAPTPPFIVLHQEHHRRARR